MCQIIISYKIKELQVPFIITHATMVNDCAIMTRIGQVKIIYRVSDRKNERAANKLVIP